MTLPSTGTRTLDAEGLTPQQLSLVEAVATQGSLALAWEAAGYSSQLTAMRAMRSLKVQEALKERRTAALRADVASEALETMKALLKAPTPPATRFSAAKWVLEQSGHGSKEADDRDVPLHEMSDAQLHRFLEKAQQAANAGFPGPIITITPDSGALPATSDRGDG